jgi:hypothetical protein
MAAKQAFDAARPGFEDFDNDTQSLKMLLHFLHTLSAAQGEMSMR